MTSSSQEEVQENKIESGKMQGIPVRKRSESRFSGRKKIIMQGLKLSRILDVHLQQRKTTTTKPNELLHFHRP